MPRSIIKNIRVVVIILAFFLVLILVQIGKSDAAPPSPPVGSNLYPSIGNTNVRMVSETVVLDIAGNSEFPSGHANVNAFFVMMNLGDKEEQMHVRFPMNHTEYNLEYEQAFRTEYCEYSPLPSLDVISVWVNNKKVDTSITYQTNEDYYASPDQNGKAVYKRFPCWAYFWITFPPKEKVFIKISYVVPGYNSQGYGYKGYGGGIIEFAYVLGTGAGWKDTIGSAKIIARLPYDVNELNITGCDPKNCVLSRKEVTWHFEDFEPDGNLYISIIRPEIWLRILREKENIQKNPNDGEAWGRLGKAYKEATIGAKGMIFGDGESGNELFNASSEAYQNALAILPNDVDWHYGYADLFCTYAIWNVVSDNFWKRCIEQVKLTLDLNPEHEGGNEILDDIRFHQENGWIQHEFIDFSVIPPDYLILTPHPLSTAADTPLHTVGITNTAKPAIPTATKTAKITGIAISDVALENLTPTSVENMPLSETMSPNPPKSEESNTYPFLAVYLGIGIIIALGVVLVIKLTVIK